MTTQILTDADYVEFVPTGEEIWQPGWQARFTGSLWRDRPRSVGQAIKDKFLTAPRWEFRRPKVQPQQPPVPPQPPQPVPTIEWSEPFRMKAGDKKPAMLQMRYIGGDRWYDITQPETPIDEHKAMHAEFHIPKPLHTVTSPEEMTLVIWQAMPVEDWMKWNMPAYIAMWDYVTGGPRSIEYLADDGCWHHTWSITPNHPCRVKPVPSPV